MPDRETVTVTMPARTAILHRAGELWAFDGEPHRIVRTSVDMGEGEAMIELDRVENPWRDLRLAVRELRDEVARSLLESLGRLRRR